MGFGDKYAGMGTFDEAMSARPKLKPGYIHCYICGVEFDPSQSQIKGRKVCPAAHCNDCLAADSRAGKWQAVAKYEGAAPELKAKAA